MHRVCQCIRKSKLDYLRAVRDILKNCIKGTQPLYSPDKTLCTIKLVREGGVEPPYRKAPDPKSGASTNFATLARL
jgi:hypothetical protein